ncbi:lipocalin family protein [Microvirga sp. M2]|uniref:lipocalin family protein n=1 Tax=Microvirga sp. M2 TaxID=3073270 RepID=UPI0039C2E519
MTDASPVAAIPSLDLNRYLGKWYEICRLPLKWEDEAATDVTARYSLEDNGTVHVDNRCFDEEGKPTQAVGAATPVNEGKSQLKVSFLPEGLRWIPFMKGDYWVLKLDPDYRLALVGTPDRDHLWLLAREPRVDGREKEAYLAEARRQGFDLSRLITPRHTGRDVTDALLARQS